ncbi:hypothetical protein PanWU01x14_118660 [Parasponia andersonii]|uniref:Uncharacterized protein n=1 Tax=Parasponia andersonii TaxID=3476 RepID=A0A2P5CVU1_PARAD|nr:hypothetical protein PanWU01x14_118660 [Parasponia andersonii]
MVLGSSCSDLHILSCVRLGYIAKFAGKKRPTAHILSHLVISISQWKILAELECLDSKLPSGFCVSWRFGLVCWVSRTHTLKFSSGQSLFWINSACDWMSFVEILS